MSMVSIPVPEDLEDVLKPVLERDPAKGAEWLRAWLTDHTTFCRPSFNRARPEGRAMPSPAHRGEAKVGGFNPRPSRRTSDARRPMDKKASRADVSIRARPEGRAMHQHSYLSLSWLRFQSAPVPKDERCSITANS
jgi:hypothetical protein